MVLVHTGQYIGASTQPSLSVVVVVQPRMGQQLRVDYVCTVLVERLYRRFVAASCHLPLDSVLNRHISCLSIRANLVVYILELVHWSILFRSG